MRLVFAFLILSIILTAFIQITYSDVLTTSFYLPDWVFTLSELWNSEMITDQEFHKALEYLQEKNIIKLMMGKDYDVISNYLITAQLDNEESLSFFNCSSDWYITGYFTPIESDYSSSVKKILVENSVRHFKSDFLDDVKIEGWGKTQFGDYLGWYGDSFHISKSALDLHGNNLLVTTVAVDSSTIQQKTQLIIPTLPAPWNKIIFTALDVGPSIAGNHIDVYTGEGKLAEFETFRITKNFNKVCTD